MHTSAYNNAIKFYEKYCSMNIENKNVLDIGSQNFNGSMKPIFYKCNKYVGLDTSEGENVDIVANSHVIPIDNESFDIIISSSCFEHDSMFWLTFKEMARIVKPSGYIYICAPSSGPYHAYPIDCWRFYKDSWKSLETWAQYNNIKINLIESYIDTSDNVWYDSIGIYKK